MATLNIVTVPIKSNDIGVDFNFYIQLTLADIDGFPTGSVLATSDTHSNQSELSTVVWSDITFTFETPYEIAYSTNYAIELIAEFDSDLLNEYVQVIYVAANASLSWYANPDKRLKGVSTDLSGTWYDSTADPNAYSWITLLTFSDSSTLERTGSNQAYYFLNEDYPLHRTALSFYVLSSQEEAAITNRANYTKSVKVWLSQVGDYDNFDEGTKDDNAFSLAIPTTNQIRWIESSESLLLGTSGDEWKIGSNKLDTPLSPTNFGVKRQSTYGSAYIQPATVNEVLLFVDFAGRKIREMTFSADVEKYVSPDMTSLAEHVTQTGVVCLAHQKNPDSMLWCVLTDGSLISMVYDREQNVIAWSRHPTDGLVQSVCVVPGAGEDEVWISVARTNGIFVEKMASRLQGAKETSFFVDSGITYDDTATSTITGLDHLEGETVSVLADGVVFDNAVVTSGQITLKLATVTTTASTVHVGLPYTALLQPMRLVASGPLGSSMAAITRIMDLKVVFLNTADAQYGNDTEALLDFNFADERLEDAAYITGLFSGDVPVIMSGGFSMENPIFIRSSQPQPMTVKAIVAAFEQTGR